MKINAEFVEQLAKSSPLAADVYVSINEFARCAREAPRGSRDEKLLGLAAKVQTGLAMLLFHQGRPDLQLQLLAARPELSATEGAAVLFASMCTREPHPFAKVACSPPEYATALSAAAMRVEPLVLERVRALAASICPTSFVAAKAAQ